MPLFLLRHGRSLHDPNTFDDPAENPALHPDGFLQAHKVGVFLSQVIHPDVIISSESLRAIQTADPIVELTGAEFDTHPDAFEFHWGEYAGRPKTDLFPAGRISIAEELGWDFVPDGAPESRRQAGERMSGVCDEILAKYPDETVVVTAHGMVTRCGIANASEDMSLPQALAIPFANCELLEYLPGQKVAASLPIFSPSIRS